MKVAIMQPYLFPYLGYFKLINEVDCFIFLDNVQYIDRGWINRNYILNQNKKLRFTLPLESSFRNTLINEKAISKSEFPRFSKKFIKSFTASYESSLANVRVLDLVKSVLNTDEHLVHRLSAKSVVECMKLLNINSQVQFASDLISNDESKLLGSSERIITLCKMVNATKYINLCGGQELYSSSTFSLNGIDLELLDPCVSNRFLLDNAPLSIIDTLSRFSNDDIANELTIVRYSPGGS